MKLNAQNVDTVIKDCLFREGEPTEPRAMAEGIVLTFGFHPARLESHREDVASMLADLPGDFQSSKGGGMSFLNACMTKDGEHWGEHPNMESLFALGIALGLAAYCLPRDMWSVFPGSMPYIVVKSSQPVTA